MINTCGCLPVNHFVSCVSDHSRRITSMTYLRTYNHKVTLMFQRISTRNAQLTFVFRAPCLVDAHSHLVELERGMYR